MSISTLNRRIKVPARPRLRWPPSPRWLYQMGCLAYFPFNQTYKDRAAWTRAHGPAGVGASTLTVDADGTYFDPVTGNITQAIANQLRIGGFSAQTRGGGALLEGARTNLAVQSEDFGTTWTIVNGGTLATDNAVAPDGATTADEFTFAAGESSQLRLSVSPTAAEHTISVFAQQVSGVATFRVQIFDATSGHQISSDLTATSVFDRFSYTATYGGGASELTMVRNNAAGDGGPKNFWGAQLELGAFRSSYIPTTTGTVVRSADDLRYDNTNEALLEAAQGTVIMAVTPEFDGGSMGSSDIDIMDMRNAGNTDGWELFYDQSGSGNLAYSVKTGNSTVAALTGSSAAARGAKQVVAIVWGLNNFRLYNNGALVQADTTGAAPTAVANSLFIGQTIAAGRKFFGIIGELLTFNRILTIEEINRIDDWIS